MTVRSVDAAQTIRLYTAQRRIGLGQVIFRQLAAAMWRGIARHSGKGRTKGIRSGTRLHHLCILVRYCWIVDDLRVDLQVGRGKKLRRLLRPLWSASLRDPVSMSVWI